MKKKIIKQIKFSIIMPCFNEGALVQDMIKKSCQVLSSRFSSSEYELIIVNDGSTDNTLKLLQKSAQQLAEVKIISYPKNRGKGYAVKKGVASSRGQILGFIDSDLEIPPQLLLTYYDRLKKQKKDIIIGSKQHKRSISQRNFYRNFLSGMSNKLVEVLFQLKGVDTQVGIKVFRQSVAKNVMNNVKTNGFAFDIEFLVLARSHGYLISSAPVYIEQNQTKSHVNGISIFKAFTDTMRLHKRMKQDVKNHSVLFGTLRLTLLACLFLPLEFVIVNFVEY